MEYGDLRVPDAQPQTGGHESTAESQPVASASGGFDWMSAAIGAVVTAGLALVLLGGRRRAQARRQACRERVSPGSSGSARRIHSAGLQGPARSYESSLWTPAC